MKSQKQKTEEKIEDIKDKAKLSPTQLMQFGDQWLRENGIITDVTHNNIILNLYTNFPHAKFVEYYMDMDEKAIEIHLHFGFWNWLRKSRAALEEDCQELIRQYLKDYTVTLEKKIYGRRSKTSK